MQAQLEKEKSNRISLVKQYESDFIRLKKAMNYTAPPNLPQGKELSIVASSELPVLTDVESLSEGKLRWSLPEFQLARQDSIFAIYDLKRVKGQYLPYLSLYGSFATQYQRCPKMQNDKFGHQFDDNFTKTVGISLSIPIYNRHEIRRQHFPARKENRQVRTHHIQAGAGACNRDRRGTRIVGRDERRQCVDPVGRVQRLDNQRTGYILRRRGQCAAFDKVRGVERPAVPSEARRGGGDIRLAVAISQGRCHSRQVAGAETCHFVRARQGDARGRPDARRTRTKRARTVGRSGAQRGVAGASA